MIWNSKLLRIIIIAASVLVSLFFVFKVVNIISDEYDTVSAEDTTVYDTLDAKGYFIRDEELLYNKNGGTVVSTAENGEKVNTKSAVAMTFSDSGSANAYIELNYIQDELESYQTIANQTAFSDVDIAVLGDKISTDFENISSAVYDGDYSSIADLKLDYLVDVSRRQVSLGSQINCDDKINALSQQISELEKKAVATSTITSGKAGYYVSAADGYETVIPYSLIDEVNCEAVENALKTSPKKVASDCIGKIVVGYYWYLAAVIDTNDANNLKEGGSAYIIIGSNGTEKIKTEVYKLSKETDEKTVVILRSNSINSSLLTSRAVNFRIVINEYSGLKVPQKAVRIQNGEKCCYVRVGNVTKLRYLNVIYSCDDYVIASDENDKHPDSRLKKHDEIILNGRGLGSDAG